MLEIARAAHLSEDDVEPFSQERALAERDDLRVALDWGVVNDPERALELAVALENFWSAHAPTEGVSRLTDLLQRHTSGDVRLRARGYRVLAGAAHQLRDWNVADANYAQSLRLFSEVEDELGIASIKTRLAYRAWPGDRELARQLVAESEELVRGRQPVIEAINSTLWAMIAIDEDRLDEAEARARRGLGLVSGLGWTWWEASAMHLLGEIALLRGDADAAETHIREALRHNATEESAIFVLGNLASLARAALQRDELDRAALLWGVVRAEGERLPGWDERRDILSKGALDELEVAPAFERGQSLDIGDAVAIALREAEPPQTVP